MNKKILVLSLLWILMLLIASSRPVSAGVFIGTWRHYIDEGIGDPETVDPAWAYDTASGALIANIYEPLIKFDREKSASFVPDLARAWTIEDINVPFTLTDGDTYNDGSGQSMSGTYKEKISFDIRVGARFHSGDTLTVADVEYSFERWMVQHRSGGPTWMITEPTMGIGTYEVDTSNPLQDEIIDHAFRQNPSGIYGANTFEMWLVVSYPPIMGILAQFWGAIVNESFMASVGEWPGTWSDWTDYNDPGEAPVDSAGHVADGTGPFMLSSTAPHPPGNFGGWWKVGIEWSIVAFRIGNPQRIDPNVNTVEYWGGWWPNPSSEHYNDVSGTLDRVTERVVFEWGTRLADFLAGTTDTAYVPRQFKAQVEASPDIRGLKDLPSLTGDGMFFNFDIDPATPYVGTGALGSGIPLDFFSDVRVRRAFAYVFNYTKFIEQVWLGEAVQPSSPIISGTRYHLDNITLYKKDIAEATALFQAASDDPSSPAYQVMSKGFYFKMTYNTGNVPRQTTADMIKTALKEVNPSFNIATLGVTWSTYLGELWWFPSSRSIMPLYHIGWIADYPDAHNWVMPFMHTFGDFAYPSSYSNSTVDALIAEGIAAPELPPDQVQPQVWSPTLGRMVTRGEIYKILQWMYYQDVPSVMIDQATGRRWERLWVQGFYYNTIGSPDYYSRWEGLNGDVTGDNSVDSVDKSNIISVYWYDPPVYGSFGGYAPKADIGPYLLFLDAEGQPPKPLPSAASVGFVDTLDLAAVNAHLFETYP